MPEPPLVIRNQELKRRVDSLPQEVAVWKQATEQQLDKNSHFSQLQAIEVLISALVAKQQALLAALDPNLGTEAFTTASLDLIRSIIKAQAFWDFFRDKLDLRHSPQHKEPLWVADTIAWDCHRPVLDAAVALGIIKPHALREPPLVYCTAEYSPATWVRGSRPNDGRRYDLGEALLPIPVIEIPWDHVGSAWEFLSLHHEVGHDIEADLRLRPDLKATLGKVLADGHVPSDRVKAWLDWQAEVFADLCALRLAGPAFGDVLMHLLMLPPADVKSFDKDDPHPTPYLRMLMVAAYCRTLASSPAIQDHATKLEQHWRALYGATSGDPQLDAFTADFSLVFTALMSTPMSVLCNHAVEELVPFEHNDDARIRSAEKFFRTGMNKPASLPIRHVPSAARLAVTAANEGGTLNDEMCDHIQERVLAYVRDIAPKGLRGGGAKAHEAFIASFAERAFLE